MSEQVSVLAAPRDRDRFCIDCGQGITKGSKTGRCRRCSIVASRAKPRACSACGRSIKHTSLTGLCQACWRAAGQPRAGEVLCSACGKEKVRGNSRTGLCIYCWLKADSAEPEPAEQPPESAPEPPGPMSKADYILTLRAWLVFAEPPVARAIRTALAYLRDGEPGHVRWILWAVAGDWRGRKGDEEAAAALDGIVEELRAVRA